MRKCGVGEHWLCQSGTPVREKAPMKVERIDRLYSDVMRQG
jgi:hypothetical protein